MRNLTKTIVAVSLLTSTSAYALGIGEIKLHSALNQNLDAEIALFASTGESVSNIQVRLAPPAKFDAAGVPWSYFLSKIRFTPVTKADGSIVVKLSSSEALKEPFLNFLIEVSWPNGNQYREFTVLVDPPASYQHSVTPAVASAPTSISKAETRLVTPEDYRQPATSINSRASAPLPAVQSNNEPITEYGPVQRTDTLWSIANRVRPANVSTAQMAVAIFHANPDAFAKPNINTLRSGEMLSIPEADVALEISHRKALTEFKQQRKAFQQEARQAQIAKRPQVKPAPEQARVNAEEVEATQPPAPKPEAVAAKPINPTPPKQADASEPKLEVDVKPGKQLTLEPPAESAVVEKDALANAGNGLESQQAAAALAAATAAKEQALAKEEQAFEQRFQKIEEQLLMMEKMLALKNAQLAAIDPNAKSPIAQDLNSKAAPADNLATLAPQPQVAPTPELKPASAPPAIVTPPAPTAAVPPPVDLAVVDSSSSYYLVAGGFSTLLLGALGFLWWRKRQAVYEEDLDDMLSTSSQMHFDNEGEEAFKPAKYEQNAAYDVGMVSESAFLSEFTPSEFDAFDPSQTEIDPISEADVYLAYGRYQQAEDLMRQAIIDQPDRNECKLKLLEIFYVNENKVAFDTYVQELLQQGKQNDLVFWDKVVEMANVLSPGTDELLKPATFTNSPNAATENDDFNKNIFSINYADVKPDPVEPEAIDLNFNASAAALDALSEENEEKDNSSLDFDIKLLTQNKQLSPEVDSDDLSSPHAKKDENALDFDLSLFLGNKEAQTEAPASEPFEDPNAIDFDFSAFAEPESQVETLEFNSPELPAELSNPIAEIKSDIETLDFNFDDFSSKIEMENPPLNSITDFSDNLSLSSDPIDTDNEYDLSVDSTFEEIDLNDFDFIAPKELKTAESLNSITTESNLPQELEGFDFDFTLDDLQNDSNDSNYDLTSEEELGDFDFSLESLLADQKEELPETTELEPLAPTVLTADNTSVDDLTDGSGSLETKINLANAYIDMGDLEAAKAIADTLLQGSKKQKKAGREILAKIT